MIWLTIMRWLNFYGMNLQYTVYLASTLLIIPRHGGLAIAPDSVHSYARCVAGSGQHVSANAPGEEESGRRFMQKAWNMFKSVDREVNEQKNSSTNGRQFRS